MLLMNQEMIPHEIVLSNPDIEVRFFPLESREHYVAPHWHNSLEFIYMIEGTMITQFENNVRQMYKGGEFSVVNPRAIHSVKVSENKALVLQIPSAFMEKYVPFHDFLEFSVGMHPENEEDILRLEKLKKIFTDMHSVYDTRPDAYLLRFNSLLYDLLYTLVHHYSVRLTDNDITRRNRSINKVRDIMRYIEKHHAEKIVMEDIASHFGYNPDYLAKFFKKYLGLTVMQYLYEVRLNRIVRDLQETDLSIGDIFEKHGCTNYKYTMQLFRERYKCTPKEKRKELKGNF